MNRHPNIVRLMKTSGGMSPQEALTLLIEPAVEMLFFRLEAKLDTGETLIVDTTGCSPNTGCAVIKSRT